MPSELDLAIDATISRLMKNDGPLAITYVEKFGVQMPMIAKAPANLADYLTYFCALNADKEFLVDGECRGCHESRFLIVKIIFFDYQRDVGEMLKSHLVSLF